jgi:hypothetical protein
VGYSDILRDVKVLVSFDDRLLRRIDRAAKATGMTRSGYLADLAVRELGMAKGPGATRRTRGALRRLDALFAQLAHDDGTAAIRSQRDART